MAVELKVGTHNYLIDDVVEIKNIVKESEEHFKNSQYFLQYGDIHVAYFVYKYFNLYINVEPDEYDKIIFVDNNIAILCLLKISSALFFLPIFW